MGPSPSPTWARVLDRDGLHVPVVFSIFAVVLRDSGQKDHEWLIEACLVIHVRR